MAKGEERMFPQLRLTALPSGTLNVSSLREPLSSKFMH